jgi:Leucine-rich repeat (LRR) protein
LTNLEILNLESNRFDNSILSYVKEFSFLKTLYLSDNRLDGIIDLKG